MEYHKRLAGSLGATTTSPPIPSQDIAIHIVAVPGPVHVQQQLAM